MVQPVPLPDSSVSPNGVTSNTLTSEAMSADQVGEFVATESPSLLESVAELLQAELVDFDVVEVAMMANDSATVSYDVSLSWTQLAPSSTAPVTSTERIIVLIGADEPPETTAVFEYEDKHVSIWRYPFDPELPSMPSVLMAQNQFAVYSNVELHSYRPMKRAVASMDDERGDRVFAKLMAPYRVARTVDNHQRLAEQGVRVPAASLVDGAPDVLLTTGVPGVGFTTLVEQHVQQWSATEAEEAASPGSPPNVSLENRVLAGRLGDSDAVIRAVLEQIKRIQTAPIHTDSGRVRPARRQPIRDLSMRVGQIETIDPSTRPMLSAITQGIGTSDEDKDVMVHGDFHPGQIFLDLEPGENPDGDIVVHIIDLDDVGYGHRLDDLSHMLAHLIMQQLNLNRNMSESGTLTLPWLSSLLRYINDHNLNSWELTRRTAAHLVGLVIGSYRAQEMNWRATLHQQLAFIVELVRAGDVPLEMTREEKVAI